MAHYGQVFENIDIDNRTMFKHFAEYFNDPVMIKIKDVDGYSMYMRKTHCLLSKECRYLIAFVTEDQMPPKSQERLIDLDWVSFQTRTLPDQHDIPSHSYQPRADGALNAKIERTSKNDDSSSYMCKDLPITVVLLNTKKGVNDYQNQGSVIAALETYNTIICVVKEET
jgi:hypothetical protein